MNKFEYLIVGSGCSGAMAAQTLVESGANVVMIDVGDRPNDTHTPLTHSNFLSTRQEDPEQYKHFIGEDASGIGWDEIGKGAQITPPRDYMLHSARSFIPLNSKNFFPLESLGYGGLGIGWGLQCWEYSDSDMIAAGLPVKPMRAAYEIISKRIGISATKDGGAPYTLGNLKAYQPSPQMDRNHRYIYEKYQARRNHFERRGIHAGRTPLALLTKDQDDRKAYAYRDMDFYSDEDMSAWRPWMTVNKLRKEKNFTYIDRQFVTRFHEGKSGITVDAQDVDTGKQTTFRCRWLILGTSALGSARLVLRSLGDDSTRLPLLCNPYTYIPCLQPALVGKGAEAEKLGFGQISFFLDRAGDHTDNSVASLYSYQSLMMFRSIRQIPLDFADSRELLRYLMTGLVIMAVHHPDHGHADNYLQLVKAHTKTGDTLKANYAVNDSVKNEHSEREKKFMKALCGMRTYPIKRIDPGNGASIHYAGTLPFSREEKPFTLASNGRLHGTKHVYVADSSGFTYLPAPGLTFSLMANAHLVAKGVLENVD